MNILLVLAGDPPGIELLTREMERADLVVAVDGGANGFYESDDQPDLLLGDMDSATLDFNDKTRLIKLPDQNHTDLQKGLEYLSQHYQIDSLVLLGATGKRTDHLLNNLQICAILPQEIPLTLINDFINPHTSGRPFREEVIYRLTPSSNTDLRVSVNSTLSMFTVTEFEGLCSSGLKWELEHLSSVESHFISQSNKTMRSDPSFSLKSGCVYIAVYQ